MESRGGCGLVAIFLMFVVLPAVVLGAFIEGWNDRCRPFIWTKTAEEILPQATRKRDSDARR